MCACVHTYSYSCAISIQRTMHRHTKILTHLYSILFRDLWGSVRIPFSNSKLVEERENTHEGPLCKRQGPQGQTPIRQTPQHLELLSPAQP